MIPKLPGFPPDPFRLLGDTNFWRERLSPTETGLIHERLAKAGYLEPPGASVSDRHIAQAIEADFTDAEHDGNKPWEPDWVERWRVWDHILKKLNYTVDITYKVRRLRR